MPLNTRAITIPAIPRLFYQLTALLGFGLLVFMIYLIIQENTQDGIYRFDKVSKCQEQVTIKQFDSTTAINIIDRPTFQSANCWHPVSLPENNPVRAVISDVTEPKLSQIWYRFDFQARPEQDHTQSLMIYVPRIVAYAWLIKVDGRVVSDSRYQWGAAWNQPAVSAIYFGAGGQKRQHVVDIGVIASEMDGYSMSRISMGDVTKLRQQQNFREILQVILPAASGIVLLLLFPYFMTVWLARRSEIEFFFIAATSLAFGITNLRYSVTYFGNIMNINWLSTAVYELPAGWLPWLLYLSTARFFKYKNRLLEWLLWVNLILSFLSIILNVSTKDDYGSLRAVMAVLSGTAFIFTLVWQGFDKQAAGFRVVVLALFFSLIAGINDTAVMFSLISPECLLLHPYASVSIFIAFFYAIQQRYVAAVEGQEQLNSDLSQRLLEKDQLTQQLFQNELKLRRQQQRLIEFERNQTLAEERQRLMHDMHDGLGASLLSTLAAIERDQLPTEAVAEALRACIEDLRLVIDSLEPTSNDLATLLGMIRYRLGQRLDAAGLNLAWEINELPPLPWLAPPDALNVLRLVQEALVNVLKHANASQVSVATRHLGDQVAIIVKDNGKGFVPGVVKPSGRGLNNQRKRAESLGGKLLLESELGQGTTIRLILPIKKPSA